MARSKIYTKKGDDGTTSLVGGKRINKSSMRVEAYGTVDELNANLGYLVALMTDEHSICFIKSIQEKLFSIGGYLASEPQKIVGNIISCEAISEMEVEIDSMDSCLQPIHCFVLPGGNHAAAYSHVCRTVCRRTERRILALQNEQQIDANVLKYMNRLSDYLFILSRFLNIAQKKTK